MDNGSDLGEWGKYLRLMTKRPGWSVARLARDAGLNPSTIFGYINGSTGQKVTIETIVAIARALGDHPVNTFIAAAGLVQEEPQDHEIGLILGSDLSDEEKLRQIHLLERRREQDQKRRVTDTVEMLRTLGDRAS
jgi:transcriptional regulator with XRE-family HTH domain